MTVVDALYDQFREVAEQARISTVTIGLGYTAVQIGDDVGLAYTMAARGVSCTRVRTYRDYEGAPASELLVNLRSDDETERALGLALVNALNRRAALSLPVDDGREEAFVRLFAVGKGTHVSMVGFFGPVIERLKRLGAEVEVLDRDRRVGDEAGFLERLGWWPDVLVVTATTILSASLERFLVVAGRRVKTVILGPSTPMVPAAFSEFAVSMIAGMVPLEVPGILSAIRQGAGTRELTPLCRRVYWRLNTVA